MKKRHLVVASGLVAEVWNADNGEVVRGLHTGIRSVDEWSPDGNYVAAIWPHRERQVDKNGRIYAERKGGIRVRSTQTGVRFEPQYLEDNKGLHPPWGRIDEPLIFLDSRDWDSGNLRVHNRDTGEMVSELGVRQLTGMTLAGSPEFAALDKGRLIAVSTADRIGPAESRSDAIQGYVVLIDVIDRREITRTRVGERCTNAVVAYE